MATRVLIPTALRPYTGGREAIEIDAATVGELIDRLTAEHAELKRHLCSPDGKVRHFVNIYLNDEDIRYLKNMQTPLAGSEVLSIVPSIAGGVAPPPPPTPAPASPPKPSQGQSAGGATATPTFTQDEIKRYSRHLIMPEVGMEGQRKLKNASVLCVGAGGLGAPLTMYLAAAGVGHLGLVDFDVVEFSNLQRQIIHSTEGVGRKKLESARDRLHGLNPEIDITLHEVVLNSENALDIIRGYDIVADGTDNYPTRYLVNDACVLLTKPNVYGSIFRFEGQATIFDALRGPCYRCLYAEPPPPGLVPSCAEGGVLGVLPGIIGCIQAMETVKLILDKGDLLIGRLLLFNAMSMTFREVKLRKNPECPICGPKRTIHELIDYNQFCGVPGHGEPAEAAAADKAAWEIDARALKEQLDRKAVTLIDVREPHEWDICHIAGAKLIPLGEIPNRLAEMPLDGEIVLHCHKGVRSMRALEFLRDHAGLTRVKSLRGGIDAWSTDVDASVPRY